MAGLEDLIRSSAPGGGIGKPLMLALLALLASGVLFRGGSTSAPTTTGAQPTSDEGAVSYSEDWAGCWTNCKRAGWVTLPIPG
jgi:hypothetical protein